MMKRKKLPDAVSVFSLEALQGGQKSFSLSSFFICVYFLPSFELVCGHLQMASVFKHASDSQMVKSAREDTWRIFIGRIRYVRDENHQQINQ